MQNSVLSMIQIIKILKKKIDLINKNLKAGTPTVPSILKEELECNIFLKAENIEAFSKLRDLKDNF